MSDQNEMRAEFGNWHKQKFGFDLGPAYDNDGGSQATRWSTWQAARATPAPQAAPSDVLDKFAVWKGYPLPALNGDGQFDRDYLHREFVAFKAGLAAAPAVAITQAATSEPVAEFPPLPRSVFTHPAMGEMWDRFAMHQYAMKYANVRIGAYAAPVAHLAGTTPNTEAPSVKTWQERVTGHTVSEYPSLMKAEIADLRAALSAQQAGVQEAPKSSYDFEDQLDRLITDVSNASHKCGGYNMEDGEEGYEPILKAAWATEEKLRAFVRSVSRAALAAATQTEKP